MLLRDEALFLHALDDLVDHIAQFLILRKIGILQQLFHQFRRDQIAFLERAQNRFAQLVHMLLGEPLHIQFINAVLRVESALKEKVGEPVHQILQVNIVRCLRLVSRIACISCFHQRTQSEIS